MNAAEAVIHSLQAHDVEHIFGVCGDTSVGLYRAFAELDHTLTHVLARDERSAAFMADAYARLANKPGVCEAPSGGGATYLLPGLAEANDSSIPVIGLNTNIPLQYRGRGVLTELDQDRLFDPLTKWNTTVQDPALIPHTLRQAFRHATTGRPGAVHVSLPMDVLAGTTSQSIRADPETTRYPAYRPPPNPESIEEAAALLAQADRPVAVVGGGIYSSQASTTLRSFTDHTGIPAATTLTAAGCLGDSPYSIGVIGENGGRLDAEDVVRDADTILLLGTAVESVWTHKWTLLPDVPIIHADIDPTTIGRNYHPDVALHGDLRPILDALIKELPASQKWSTDVLQQRRTDWWAHPESAFTADAYPLLPERLVRDTHTVLDEDAIIVSDPGTTCPYFAAYYPFKRPGRHWVTPRAHGALGYAIPGVVGAHFAKPDHHIIGFTGDGSLGTTAGELETLARYELPVTVVVINNAGFSWIEAGQRNYADFSWGVDFTELNYAELAESFGLDGHRVTATDEYVPALERAVSADTPTLIDVPVEPLPSAGNPPVEWLTPPD